MNSNDQKMTDAKAALANAIMQAKAKCEESISKGENAQTAYYIFDKEIERLTEKYYQTMGWR